MNGRLDGGSERAFEHCRRLVARADNDRYLAALFAPEQRRAALFALYAFNIEVAGVAGHVREPMAGEVRLQWWREAISGARAGEAASHPVAAALRDTMQRHAITATPLIALIDAHTFDIYPAPMADVAALEDYARSTEINLVSLAAGILGPRSEATDAICAQAGSAGTYAAILHNFARDAARRRLFIPADILGHHHAGGDSVFGMKATTELRAALAEMRLRARRHLDAAQALIAKTPAEILPALLPAALLRPRLAKMERKSYDPYRPGKLFAPRRQWLLWRAARNPRRIFG